LTPKGCLSFIDKPGDFSLHERLHVWVLDVVEALVVFGGWNEVVGRQLRPVGREGIRKVGKVLSNTLPEEELQIIIYY
jgi:hypothetical protein